MNFTRVSLARWVAAVVLLVASMPTLAQVVDNAGVLSEQGKRDAESRIAAVHNRTGRQVRVETYPQIPSDQRAAFDAASNKAQFYDDWTHARGAASQADVLLLINMNPGHAEIGEAERIRSTGAFTTRDRRHVLDDVLVPALKAKDYDRGVAESIDAIGAALQRNGPANGASNGTGGAGVPSRTSSTPTPTPMPPSTPTQAPPTGRTSTGVGTVCGGGGLHFGWLCLAVGVIIILVLVRGLRRVMGGGGGGNYARPGYGQPGYGQPGYGGGGGGGFGRGLLGGLLGGMLGGAAYDHFSHRGDQAGAAPPPGGGPLPPDTGFTPGPNDFQSSSGADFDSGGGGGGGADFGGGGGGGDSGSSGADF